MRWPGEKQKVKGKAGRARGRQLSLAMQLDLLTHNFKFLQFFSPSHTMLILSLLPDQAGIDIMSPTEF